jgi:lipoyl(octanoyl) transferase
MRRVLSGFWLGREPYERVHALQRDLQSARQAKTIGDVVLFLEHEPVITLGRGAHAENVLFPRELLRARGVELCETGRGGDVTLHAPGQLVAYPILDLAPDRRDVRRYVRDLTEVMRRLAASYSIETGPDADAVGLWADRRAPGRWQGLSEAAEPAKLGAIGVRISRWVTMHGFAFNLTTDLELFGLIVPCGIRNRGVTSVRDLVGESPDVHAAAVRALAIFGDVFDADVGELAMSSELPLVARTSESVDLAH